MTQFTRTFLGITRCMDRTAVFEKENSTDRNCIDPI